MTNIKLSAVQIRMARAALRLGVRDVAKMSGVSPTTIGQIERERTIAPEPATLAALRATFEREGIVFLDEDGVKLGKKSAQANISWQANR